LLKNQAVYLVAIGGAGAMLGKCVKNSEIIAYEELGPEAIYKLEVENFPAIVCWDTKGNDAYIQ
jgi:fumarate hydratase subunit beta